MLDRPGNRLAMPNLPKTPDYPLLCARCRWNCQASRTRAPSAAQEDRPSEVSVLETAYEDSRSLVATLHIPLAEAS